MKAIVVTFSAQILKPVRYGPAELKTATGLFIERCKNLTQEAKQA